jgi:hypothetical protein
MKVVIQFKDQADAIEQLCMKVFGAKPEYLERVASAPANGFRYFRDDMRYWKMPLKGDGFTRMHDEQWSDSICNLEDMLYQSIPEISAEEGEP